MSEFVDNETLRREARRDALKKVITGLHEGRTVDEVKGEFAELLGDVGGGEIAELEQALIADGLPEQDIKRLCDVHVAVFQDALDTQPEPDTVSGHPLDTLRAENSAVESVIRQLEEAVEEKQWKRAREVLATLRDFEKHYLRKENILFPYLEKHGFSGPSSVMWAIHDDIRAGWRGLQALLDAGPNGDEGAFLGQVSSALVPLTTAIRDMIYKEEHILAQAALERLDEDEWRDIREQEPEIGFFAVKPVGEWPARSPVRGPNDVQPVTQALPEDRQEGIQLDTGVLTGHDINLMLKALPVDVTFVGADDTVRYFSSGPERIFPRSPAIIGRSVQKCHPPKSVHVVQEILGDFRSGARDTAEFWIQRSGRFVYIRYFAVRDGDGEYRGTLEVSQDVTAIRELEGERRILEGRDDV